ncbi:hypothetical protein [Dictyobacter arantiisoli]|uniref:Uncharacterized protein n=1 Tax=Dictyobacter arantiisoli TaxID=2014874 RepID=A0A5A5TJE2_9CHLR|nr:hypothetical protein [Dictyobacter arantiisoli]GCF11731.1 hypothetical protein KDI_52950 [Dictyobacter arantiisoli]
MSFLQDTKDVIRAELQSLASLPSEYRDALSEQSGFIRSVRLQKHLPQGANLTTLHFLKEVSVSGYCVHAIRFEDTAKVWWILFCLVLLEPTGQWTIKECSGLAGNTAMSRPPHLRPTVQLYGNPDAPFYAGGFVIDDQHVGIQRVRLQTPSEMLEDTVLDNLVLYVHSESISLPIQAKLYNAESNLVETHTITLLPMRELKSQLNIDM